MKTRVNGAWVDWATTTGGGPSAPRMTLNLANGSFGGAVITTIGDELWDHVDIVNNGTNMSTAFRNQSRITRIPPLPTANATNLSYAFDGCSSLATAPDMDLSECNNLEYTFNRCMALTTVPAYPMPKVSSMISTFNGCTSLESITILSTNRLESLASTFYGCTSLKSVSFADTFRVSNFASTFRDCTSMTVSPEMDTSYSTNFNGTFYGCRSLVSIPAYDTARAVNMAGMLYNCASLTEVPALAMGVVSSTANAAILGTNPVAMPNLVSFKAFGSRYGFSVARTGLGAEALNKLFANLGTPNGTQTINISGTPGAATCDRSIATSKGWTVVG